MDQPLPIGRRDSCRACEAELHVCRMCRDYAPSRSNQCAEPMAEDVRDKTSANFCGYFAPRPHAYEPADDAQAAARAALEDLFK